MEEIYMAKVIHLSDYKKAHQKARTIDDFLHDLRGKAPQELKEAFSHYDEHMDEDNQNDMELNLFGPAIDAFYSAFTEKMDEEFEDETIELHKNHDGVKKAVLSGLKAYLKRARPKALELIKGVDDEIEQYKILTTYVDHEMPFVVNQQGQPIALDDFIKSLVDDKKKVSEAKIHFSRNRANIASIHKQHLNAKYRNHLFGTYASHDLAAHLKPKAESKYEVDDAVKFANLEKGEIFQLYDHLSRGKPIEELGKYGLKQKKEEEEELRKAA